jgi:hypothetical protein
MQGQVYTMPPGKVVTQSLQCAASMYQIAYICKAHIYLLSVSLLFQLLIAYTSAHSPRPQQQPPLANCGDDDDSISLLHVIS